MNKRLTVLRSALVILAAALVAAWGCWAEPGTVIGLLTALRVGAPKSLRIHAFAKETERLSKAADAGDAKAKYELFQRLSGTTEAWKCERLLRESAELGCAEAQYELGERSRFAEDHSNALQWYRRAALQDHPGANLELARKYRTGEGVPQDYWKALHLLEKAAEGGEAFAAEALGSRYLYGEEGSRRDPAQACEWLFITRALGNGPTCDASVQATLTTAEVAEAKESAARFLHLFSKIGPYPLKVKRQDWASSP